MHNAPLCCCWGQQNASFDTPIRKALSSAHKGKYFHERFCAQLQLTKSPRWLYIQVKHIFPTMNPGVTDTSAKSHPASILSISTGLDPDVACAVQADDNDAKLQFIHITSSFSTLYLCKRKDIDKDHGRVLSMRPMRFLISKCRTHPLDVVDPIFVL